MSELFKKIINKFEEEKIPVAFYKVSYGEKNILIRTGSIAVDYGYFEDNINSRKITLTNPKVVRDSLFPITEFIFAIGESSGYEPKDATGGFLSVTIKDEPSYDDANLKAYRKETEKTMKELNIKKV